MQNSSKHNPIQGDKRLSGRAELLFEVIPLYDNHDPFKKHRVASARVRLNQVNNTNIREEKT